MGSDPDEVLGIYPGSVARRPEDLPTQLPVDVVRDGLSDDDVAASFADWLAAMDETEPIELGVSAADELAAARAAGEV
jgi:hypothetical protein